jgi:hypothetical protein
MVFPGPSSDGILVSSSTVQSVQVTLTLYMNEQIGSPQNHISKTHCYTYIMYMYVYMW